MIVTKTPLRVSFFGGGSDIEAFYEDNIAAVLSVTIDSHIRIATQKVATPHVKAMYSVNEQVETPDQLEHDRIRECLKEFGIHSNIEIASFADIPTKGTGLGSSSAFTVGLIEALAAQRGFKMSRYDVANLACDIEIEKCSQRIGKQDQFAAAYGGMNFIQFSSNAVEVSPLSISLQKQHDLNSNLLCFYTGKTRSASEILDGQVSKLESKSASTIAKTQMMVDLAYDAKKLLLQGKLDDFGALLHEGWKLKSSIAAGITNPDIDDMYARALNAGALGGKVLGAGGGGFLLLYVPFMKQPDVINALWNYKRFEFNFTDKGSQVVYNDE